MPTIHPSGAQMQMNHV